MNIYYLGLKDKTVQNTKFFKDVIVIKSSKKTNIPYYEEYAHKELDYNLLKNSPTISHFYDEMIRRVSLTDPYALFIPYNQGTKKYMNETSKLICTNDINLINSLNNKPNSRRILNGIANCLDYVYMKGKNITFDKINTMFNNASTKYVIQEFEGFGGVGTYVFTKENENYILSKLHPEDTYSISKYIENNISVNNTFMIGDEIIIFDGTIQNIVANDELLYDGWSFDNYRNLDPELKKKIEDYTLNIAKKLKNLGYVGVGGIDYIVRDGQVYFMEINPRFQASSEGVDKRLQEQGFPSIFELQFMCFYDKDKYNDLAKQIKGMKIWIET